MISITKFDRLQLFSLSIVIKVFIVSLVTVMQYGSINYFKKKLFIKEE